MLAMITGIARSSSSTRSCTSATTAVTDALPLAAAIAMCSRESASRRASGVQSVASARQRCSVARSAAVSGRPAASAAAPGSMTRRRSRVSSRRVAQRRGRRVGAQRPVQLGRDDERAAAAAAPRLDQAALAQRLDRLAQGHPADAEGVGQFALGRQLLAVGQHAEPDALRQPLDRDLEGVADRHRREDRLRPQRLDVAGDHRRATTLTALAARELRAAATKSANSAGAVEDLGVPLHGDHPGRRRRSSAASIVPSSAQAVGDQPVGEHVDGLVVVGRDLGLRRRRSRRCGCPGAVRIWCRPWMPGVGECSSWPTRSGRCWIRVPPRATLSVCMPRQTQSSGRPRSSAQPGQGELPLVALGPRAPGVGRRGRRRSGPGRRRGRR